MFFFSTVLLVTLALVPGGLTLVIRDTPTPQDEINQYLSSHNDFRKLHGAAPLAYSQDLAAKAQQWANNCQFRHSGGLLGPFGENLAAGAGNGKGFSFPIADAVKDWTDEAKNFDPRNPQPSHFTQVVWKATEEVGCAHQQCNGIFGANFGEATFYVCEYSPQGNVIGQFSQNVEV